MDKIINNSDIDILCKDIAQKAGDNQWYFAIKYNDYVNIDIANKCKETGATVAYHTCKDLIRKGFTIEKSKSNSLLVSNVARHKFLDQIYQGIESEKASSSTIKEILENNKF